MVCSRRAGSRNALLLGATLVLGLAQGCGGSVTSSSTSNGGGGGAVCDDQIDCGDGCGNFIGGDCIDGVYVCPDIQPGDCGGGGSGGTGGGGAPQSPPAKWSMGFGDSQYQEGSAIAVGASGEIALGVTFGGTVDLGGGPLVNAVPELTWDHDIAIAKLTPDGQHVWSRSFGSPGKQRVTDIAVDSAGDIVFGGSFEGELDLGAGPLSGVTTYIAKLDPAGNLLWSKGLPTSGDLRLEVGPADEIVLSGTCNDGADFGGGPLAGAGKTDICVAALDPDGAHVWSRLLGGPSYDYPYDVAVGPGGEVAITGMFKESLSLSLPEAIASAGEFDAFAAVLDPTGQVVWARGYGGAADDGAGSVVWSDEGPVLTGWFDGAVDFGGGALGGAGTSGFVLWLDTAGGHRASTAFRGLATLPSGSERWWLARLPSQGGLPSPGVVLVGGFDDELEIGSVSIPQSGSLSQSGDLALLRFTSDGQLDWAHTYGDDYAELPGAVAASSTGEILVTGTYYGAPDFGGGPLPSAGNGDLFVVAF